MITRPKILKQAACIVLLLMLVPHIALSQEQKGPAVSQPEKTATEPAQQKSDSLITLGQEKQEPAAVAPKQEDSPIIPGQEKQEPAAVAPKQEEAVVSPKEPAEIETTPASEDSTPYVIKQGDTLWDIANAFLRDPFLWPFIWKANPAITNPDLIYPGNKLAIPSLGPIERALAAPIETRPKEQLVEKQPAPKEPVVAEEPTPSEELKPQEGIAAALVKKPKQNQPEPGLEAPVEGSRLVMPEEQPIPIIDKYAMLSAGFVNEEDTKDVILRSIVEPKTQFGYDDVVYVKMRDPEKINIGDKFLIFTPLNNVYHPKTGKRYGKLTRGLGILQITAKDTPDILTARITLSFSEIGKGSMLTPYQEPTLLYHSSDKKAKDITGYILEVTDSRSINAQTDIVYLDKGNADGVEPGDTFIVYAEDEGRGLPRKKIGEVQVFLVKERTSTAMVRRSIDTMAKGDMMNFKK